MYRLTVTNWEGKELDSKDFRAESEARQYLLTDWPDTDNIANIMMLDSDGNRSILDDVINNFLWRAQDWHRNSLQMYAQSVFSHKQLHGKNQADIHDMLHSKGMSWSKDLTMQQKNGTFIIVDCLGWEECYEIQPTYESISNEISHLF